MKILMVAPEPFFDHRGTPLSVYHRVKALTQLGHEVHLVTYPFGEPVDLPGVRIFRSMRLPFLRRVKVGPSWAKIPMDILLFLEVFARLCRDRYDGIHTHEEAAILGAVLRRVLGLPHLYDMHSSLPQQFENFSFTKSRGVIKIWKVLERWAVTSSDLVICICPSLEDVVKEIDPERTSVVIENPPLLEGGGPPPAEAVASVRHRLGLLGRRVVLYTGTFEPYQGVDLLLRSAPRILEAARDVRFLLVGGDDRQIPHMRELGRRLGVLEAVTFTGQRPLEEMPVYLEIADILVSPRVAGMNTPLKIYSYLASGRPIVATRIPSHTQVLTPEVSLLTDPTPEGLAAGIGRLLEDRTLAEEIGRRAKALAEARFSHPVYRAKVREAYRLFAHAMGEA